MSTSCPSDCTLFSDKKKFESSWWVALTVFLCYFIIGSPFVYWLTSFMKTTVTCAFGPLGKGQSWWGWIFHSIVAGFLGLGLGYAFMMPGERAKCCCPLTTSSE